MLTSLSAVPSGSDKILASWHSEVSEITPATKGAALRTVIRLEIADGWHTYWINPGEGGLPLRVEPKLPKGWSAGSIQYLPPIRFMTGELPGFGYEQLALFPLTITPPPDFTGPIPKLQAEIKWLTCNDSACVPGSAEVTLDPTNKTSIIADAYAKIPVVLSEAALSFTVDDKDLLLELTVPLDQNIDFSKYSIFPITEDRIAADATPRFTPKPSDPETWTATAPMSEYMPKDAKDLQLLLTATTLPSAIIITPTDELNPENLK